MSTHHKTSPSKLKDFETCPGFIPDEYQDTTKADEGSLCHLAAEKEDPSILATDEQKFTVQKCLNYANTFTTNAVFDRREVKLSVLNGLTTGTSDRIIGRKTPTGKLHIDQIDWKFGANAVDDAETNRQGIAYVLAVFEEYPEAVSITMHFVLPRRDEVTKHTFFRKDMPRLAALIKEIISRVHLFNKTQDVKMLRPTERCTFCGRLGLKCPAVNNYAWPLAKKYAPLEIVDEVHSSQITDLAQAAKYLTVLRVLEKMVDSGKKHLVELGMANGGLPGPDGKLAYEIAEKSGTREITDIPAAYDVIRGYLTPEEVILCSKISLPKIMEMIGDKAPPRGKTKLRGEVETKLAEVDAISYGEPSRFLRKVKE